VDDRVKINVVEDCRWIRVFEFCKEHNEETGGGKTRENKDNCNIILRDVKNF